MNANAKEALSVRGLRKHFGGVEAVKGVDFEVYAGEVVALIGSNGAGKTTCFNLINGQLRPDSGQIFLYGTDITRHTTDRLFHLGVARTFQITANFASMTVRENVQMALLSRARHTVNILSWATYHGKARALDMLTSVGLGEFADFPVSSLAYGDLKRLELAVAMANEPHLLLMDEPTAGMASQERETLMRLAVTTARTRQIAMLFVEHDMDVVFSFSDRVIVMNRGRIIAVGTPADVRDNLAVREAYLGQLAV